MGVAAKKRAKRNAPRPRNVVAEARGAGRKRSGLWENTKSIGGAILIFLVIRTFFVEAFRIPSGSMVPTLLVGDFLFVNKLAYGPKVPFTRLALPGYAEPNRGEVAIYQSPDSSDGNPTVVKRIVGVAGDTLHMRKGLLHVNGVARRQTHDVDADTDRSREPAEEFRWLDSVAIRSSRFGPPPEQPTLDDWGPIVVPPRRFFTLGDNRHDSKDARYYKFVPRENLRGRPLFIYYSYQGEGSDSAVPWLTDIRWGRIGDWVK